MPSTVTKKIFTTGGPTDISSVESRITNLENNAFKVLYFTEVSSDTGTITKPTNSTILTNQFAGGVDAYVSTISSGQPTGQNPVTAGGVTIDVASFDSSGNYTLTGVPSSYPVAIIYVFTIPALYWSNVTVTNIVEYDNTSLVPYSGATDNLALGTHGITATTYNGLTLTSSTGTFTLTNSKTLTVSNTLTLTATDGATLAIGGGGTLGSNAYTSTAYAPLASPTFTGTVTIPTPFTLGATLVTSTGTQLNYLAGAVGTTGTNTTNIVYSTSPNITTPTFTTNITCPLIIGGTGTTSTLTFRTTSNSGGTTGADFIWQSGNNGATELMKLLNSGFLGIGTSSPGSKLEIRDAGSTQNAVTRWSQPNVAHGMTAIVPTDVYAYSGWRSSTVGGYFLSALTDAGSTINALTLEGIQGATSPTKACIELTGWKKNGTTVQVLAATEQLAVFTNGGTVVNTVLADGSLYLGGTASPSERLHVNGNLKIEDTFNLIFGTSTGTKIGTATGQKIAFWNKTPIIQPTTGITGATLVSNGGTTITSTDTFGGYTLQQLAAIIINTGLAA